MKTIKIISATIVVLLAFYFATDITLQYIDDKEKEQQVFDSIDEATIRLMDSLVYDDRNFTLDSGYVDSLYANKHKL